MFGRMRDWYIATIGVLLIAGGLYFASQQASDSGAKNTEAKQIANVTSAPEAAKVPNSQSGSSSQKPPNAEAAPVTNGPSSIAAPATPAASPAPLKTTRCQSAETGCASRPDPNNRATVVGAVDFIDQQRGSILVDRAVKRSHGDVRCMDGPVDQATEHFQITRLATSLFRGADAENRRHARDLVRIGVQTPESLGLRSAGR